MLIKPIRADFFCVYTRKMKQKMIYGHSETGYIHPNLSYRGDYIVETIGSLQGCFRKAVDILLFPSIIQVIIIFIPSIII